jgi:cytochrome c
MTFAGIKNDKQRADVIAYLNTLSKNPEPLPKPQGGNAAAKPEAAAPANAPAASGAAKPQSPPAKQ